mgnify:CR=1 FL=1
MSASRSPSSCCLRTARKDHKTAALRADAVDAADSMPIPKANPGAGNCYRDAMRSDLGKDALHVLPRGLG